MELSELLNLLNTQFLNQYRTKIIGGFTEPFYKTFAGDEFAEIQFSHDYIRSALHELSHWCVAGKERRKLDDFGYWYAPDGRTQDQQNEFFKVEVKPQAIEWAFSILCEVQFEPSMDNLNNATEGADQFTLDVKNQLEDYIQNGFSKRVSEILRLLANEQGIGDIYDYIVNILGYSE